ncbi:type IVB secretion system protein IcmH/DotU [Pseudomonas fluorescens]|uniref:Type IV / VI secretion system DotU domain-containing protein n=1 Tax=Pseudomonas fluorescens TaxID=294 RepID=A0A5E7BLN8_PSEFL|nr:type IVB secretion system protein IcmH/DotU [Pseudomonas fluorescens]VVN92525.1 hypothetical protein PS723_01987 [Pseudomonas fluorescens]
MTVTPPAIAASERSEALETLLAKAIDSSAGAADAKPPFAGREDPQFQLRGLTYNPLADAAMPLFGLAMRLHGLDRCEDLTQLYQGVHNQIVTVLEEMRHHPYDNATLQAYSYSLCLFMDEIVMGTAWGKHSTWSHRSLLSAFHQENWGGEKFFTVLARMLIDADKYQHVLEVMYLCLCMGLRGKYAIQTQGDDARQKIIVKVHRALRDLRGDAPERLTEPLTNVAPRNYRVNRQWPWWTPWAAASVLLLGAYTLYAVRLNSMTFQVLNSLEGILTL